jgi:hypothetical protein
MPKHVILAETKYFAGELLMFLLRLVTALTHWQTEFAQHDARFVNDHEQSMMKNHVQIKFFDYRKGAV